jgi:sulfhydrogenase subunit gamma (sulfur reductase)
MTNNPMLPHLGRLVEVRDLATEIKLFRIELMNEGNETFQTYQPGQFAFISVFGLGEAPFGIANSSGRGDLIDFAVARLGSITTGLHELGKGDIVGVRGPFGNWFPMKKFRGKNLIVLGGGIGGAPLRPIIQHILDHRSDYGHLTIFWAARSPSLLVFTDEYDEWRASPDTNLYLTVDNPNTSVKWEHNVGLITQLLEKVAPSIANTITITCGPPIMIHFVTKMLQEKMGVDPKNNYVTLEARMHCGLGKCGRCNLGEKLICTNGPVFTMEEVGDLLETYL